MSGSYVHIYQLYRKFLQHYFAVSEAFVSVHPGFYLAKHYSNQDRMISGSELLEWMETLLGHV